MDSVKRAREEVEEQAAPMASSPTRNPGPAAAAVPASGAITGEPQVMTKDDVVAFVRRVKRAFSQAKFHEFFDVLRQTDSMGVRGVLGRAKVLLRGHPDLERHFNSFLPAQYKLSLIEDVDLQGRSAGRPIVID